MTVYLNDWAKGGEAQMLTDFNITAADLAHAEILVASYTYEDYSGDAYVLFRRNGHLYEVHGSHCSCYGLSEYNTTQWTPEETTAQAILHRLDHDLKPFADHIREALAKEPRPVTTRITVPLVVTFNLLANDDLDNLLSRMADAIRFEVALARNTVVEVARDRIGRDVQVNPTEIRARLDAKFGAATTAILLENTVRSALTKIVADAAGIAIEEAELFLENQP